MVGRDREVAAHRHIMRCMSEKIRPSRSPYWMISSPEWREHARRNGGIELASIDDPDACVIMWAHPGSIDPEIFGETDFGRVSLVAHGDRARIVELIVDFPATFPSPTWAVLPDGTDRYFTDALDSWFPAVRGNEWDFYWTAMPVGEPSDNVVILEPHVAAQLVPTFLSSANPTSSSQHSLAHYRWYALTDDSNELAAVLGAADTYDVEGSRTSYLAGLGTKPELRGKGYAGRLIKAAVAKELEDHSLAHFTMWSDNAPARSLYERLGFINDGRQMTLTSVPIERGRKNPNR